MKYRIATAAVMVLFSWIAMEYTTDVFAKRARQQATRTW